MTENGYLDPSIQKAFMPSVPGCIEHYTKLAAAIGEAHRKHKAMAVCWLDLANAYGSVSHNLISFSLRYYHAPKEFLNLIENLYSGLSASVSTKSWSTPPVPIQVGVYQGDPLSVEIFNTVINTYIDTVRPQLDSSFKFSNSNCSIGLLQYADDVCLVSDGPASCQKMLDISNRWLKWSGMKPKVSKCQAMAIKASTGKVYDPALTLDSNPIPFTGSQPVKFLGGTVEVPHNPRLARAKLQNKLDSLLARVNAAPVSRKQKLRLFKLGICPRLTWDLTINEFAVTWIEKVLDPMVTRQLKQWSGLAKPADPSRLYLPGSLGGLELPTVSGLYCKLQVGKAALLMTSRDLGVQHSMKMQIQKESRAQRIKFRPLSFVQEVFSHSPGTTRKALSTQVKKKAKKEEAARHLAHAKSLPIQGSLYRTVDGEAALLWSKAIQALPSNQMKFALNSAQDTLPHNANLALWRGDSCMSNKCRLCGDKQTLVHILNACPVALKARRYNDRHDQVLELITRFAREHVEANFLVLADLDCPQNYLFPQTIAATDLRPDLIIYNEAKKKVIIAELTVCCEASYEAAHQRKLQRYQDLEKEARCNEYTTDLLTLEVGSRSFNTASLNDLQTHLQITR